MQKIIPRWEWRTFQEDLGDAEKKIRAFPEGKTRESSEVYILSEVSNDNTKIRDGLMDIKTLQQVNEDRLEQWLPIMKGEFPLPAVEIEKVFKCFRVSLPKLANSEPQQAGTSWVGAREQYTFDEYISELIMPSSLLKAVDVFKKRTGFTINNCIVEIAEVTVSLTSASKNEVKKVIKTAAVEHEDPELVIKTVRELRLDVFPNINYLKGLKNQIGMKF